MKILITGGAGYIGSVLTEKLLNVRTPMYSDRLTVLDNFMYGGHSLAHLCRHPRLEIINGDVRNLNALLPLVSQADVIIPLAAIVGAPACDRDHMSARDINLNQIRNITRKLSKDQRMIIPITNSGYGVGNAGEECTEESPLRPVSLYGQLKVEAEAVALDHPNTISLRLATVFGWSQRMRLDLLVNDFTWRAVNDRAVVLFEADFKRNYIHVRDVCNTIVWALYPRRDVMIKGRVYNVGLSTANLSKRELCWAIAQHVPGFVYLDAPVGSDPDKRDYVVSNAKLEATGWQPKWTLDEGIVELIKGFRMLRRVAYGNV